MASSTDATMASPPESDAPATMTVHLVSPTAWVPRPLALADVPVSTTIGQLKERVRDKLQTKPLASMQRLIHRGRLLRDDETLLAIFGMETIRSAEPQNLHLVLRDESSSISSQPTPPATAATTTGPDQSQGTASGQATGPFYSAPPPNGTGPTQQQPLHQPQHQPQMLQTNYQQQFYQTFVPGTHVFPQPQPIRPGGPVNGIPVNGIPVYAGPIHGIPGQPIAMAMPVQGQMPPAQAQAQFTQAVQSFNAAVARSNMELQRLHNLQEIINQGQRERANMGLNGMQDQGQAQAQAQATPGTQTPGRMASPTSAQFDANNLPVVREGTGPEGVRWRVTMNEPGANAASAGLRNPRASSPFADWRPSSRAQSRSRSHASPQTTNPDMAAATRVISNAFRRTPSSSSLMNLNNSQATQPIPPGVTTTTTTTTIAPTPHTSNTTPEVYILSSPDGPRALMFTGNRGTYATPPNLAPYPSQYPVYPTFPYAPQILRPAVRAVPYINGYYPQPPLPTTQQIPHPTAQYAATHHPQQPPAPPLPNRPHQQPRGLPNPPRAAPHANANANANAPAAAPFPRQARIIVMARIWPHIWMLLRLAFFVWWFTWPTATWTRWFTVLTIATILFIWNTGLINVTQWWVPLRRYIDNLMPPDNHHHHHHHHPNHAPVPGAPHEINPAATAARLLQQRRQAGEDGWLRVQLRRAERAGILFLASIAPGVAERHIANVEAERIERERARREAVERVREERERRDRDAAEAAGREEDGGQGTDAGEGNDGAPPREEAPLIAV